MAQDNILNLRAVRGAELPAPCAACSVRDLSICNVLSDDELTHFTSIVSDVTIAPGQALFFEEDPADFLFVIREGCARVFKLMSDGRRMITGFLYPSDIVGLADEEGYSYGCEAVTTLTVCRMPRQRLVDFFTKYPILEHRMLEIATNELSAAQDQMLLLGRKTALEKVASFLQVLARRTERRGGAGDYLFIPMSRGDIADHLGLTTESVSRCFTQLRKKEVLKLETAQNVTILDRGELLRLTGCGDEPFEPHAAVL